MANEYHTPTFLGDRLALFAVELSTCKFCNVKMIQDCRGPFPGWRGNDLKAQAKRAGIAIQDSTWDKACKPCIAQDKVIFECDLCEQQKPSSKHQNTIGDPGSHLCKDCYETVSAKVWEEKEDQLMDKHRYDHC